MRFRMAGEDKNFQPPFFFLDFKAKNMKPEKALPHALKVRFMARNAASYGKAVLHKTPFQMMHLYFIPL